MPYLNEEEGRMASRYLFLSMTIVVLEQDIRSVENGPYKIKEPYLELLRRMIHQARTERRELRQTMDQKKIDVVFIEKNDTFSTYLFLARGYEEERRYFNPAVRKKVENILNELMYDITTSVTKPAPDFA